MKKINNAPLSAQKGFTLIELVVVIVILGILAATAAPRFVDLTGDARASTIEAVRGSIEGATSLAHSKALIDGETGAAGGLDLDNNNVDEIILVNGWPSNAIATWDQLLDINIIAAADDARDAAAFRNVVNGDDDAIVFYHAMRGNLDFAAAVATNCYVTYTESANSNVRPSIIVINTDC